MRQDAERDPAGLGLHYRVITLSPVTWGSGAAKTYDSRSGCRAENAYRGFVVLELRGFRPAAQNRYRPSPGDKPRQLHTPTARGSRSGRTLSPSSSSTSKRRQPRIPPAATAVHAGLERVGRSEARLRISGPRHLCEWQACLVGNQAALASLSGPGATKQLFSEIIFTSGSRSYTAPYLF